MISRLGRPFTRVGERKLVGTVPFHLEGAGPIEAPPTSVLNPGVMRWGRCKDCGTGGLRFPISIGGGLGVFRAGLELTTGEPPWAGPGAALGHECR